MKFGKLIINCRLVRRFSTKIVTEKFVRLRENLENLWIYYESGKYFYEKYVNTSENFEDFRRIFEKIIKVF